MTTHIVCDNANVISQISATQQRLRFTLWRDIKQNGRDGYFDIGLS